MVDDISGLTVVYAGIGGFKEVKPIPTPIEKLTKYAKQNNVTLSDLFAFFDKDKTGELPEEEFRKSLKVNIRACNELYFMHCMVL